MKIKLAILFFVIVVPIFAQNVKKMESYLKKTPFFEHEKDSIAIKRMNSMGFFDFEIKKNENKIRIVLPVKNYKGKVQIWVGNKKVFNKIPKNINKIFFKIKKQVEININWVTILRSNAKNKIITIIDEFSKEYIQFSINGTEKYKNIYAYRYVSSTTHESRWVLKFRNSMDRIIVEKN